MVIMLYVGKGTMNPGVKAKKRAEIFIFFSLAEASFFCLYICKSNIYMLIKNAYPVGNQGDDARCLKLFPKMCPAYGCAPKVSRRMTPEAAGIRSTLT